MECVFKTQLHLDADLHCVINTLALPGGYQKRYAASPVQFGPMGTVRVSVCSPWRVGWQWWCTAIERGTCSPSQATTGPSESWKSHYDLLEK